VGRLIEMSERSKVLVAEGAIGNWYGPGGHRLRGDHLDDLPDRLPSEADAEVGGDDPPSDGYRCSIESGKSGVAHYRLLAIAAGATAVSISTAGAIAMSMLPELIKSFGAENALLAIIVFVLSGWSGFAVIAYLFYKHVNASNKENIAFLQQVNKDQKMEQRTRVKEIKESYRDGYRAGLEHESISSDDHQSDHLRWKKD
jgi:hypothetical protein